MKNVTLAIDDELLEASRRYAQEHEISLNALIRELLEQTVLAESRDWVDELLALPKGRSGGKKWRRSDLYDV